MNKQTWMKRLGIIFGIGILFFLGLYLSTAAVRADPSEFDWSKAGDFQLAAGDGVAFILSDTLHYAGGWIGNPADPFHDVSVLSLSDGASDVWLPAAQLNPGRFGAAATTSKGYAYIFGGYSGGYLSKVERFNGQQWDEMSGLPGGPRAFFAATTLNDHVYVAGGLPGPTDQVWKASLTEGGLEWATTVEPSLHTALLGLGLVSYEDCLFVVGGKDVTSQPHSEIYSSAIAQDGSVAGWAKVGDIINAASGAAFPLAFHGTTVHRGKLYILGGETPGAGFSNMGFSVSLNANCTLGSDWESFTMPDAVGLRRMAVASRWGELYIIGGQTADGYSSDAWKTTLATPNATLTLQKSDALDGDFDYGKLITYTLSYTNPWEYPDGQRDVVITDTLPASTTLISATPGYVLTDTDTLQWDIVSLAKDARGAVKFTVQAPSPDLAWDMSAQQTKHWSLKDSTYISSSVIYTVAYTPTAEASDDAVLITATLPAQLSPVRADPSGVAYAVQGNSVIWRVPGPVAATGQVSVTTCVSQAFNAQDPLTYTAALEDVLGHTITRTYTQALAPGDDTLVAVSCPTSTNPIIHPVAVTPLYPSFTLRNQAWICSNELGGCQLSNETVTRHWPVKVFLPLVIKQ